MGGDWFLENLMLANWVREREAVADLPRSTLWQNGPRNVKMGPIGCPETSVTICHSALYKIRRSKISFTPWWKPEVKHISIHAIQKTFRIEAPNPFKHSNRFSLFPKLK
jgi:hypothetical protein